MASPNRTPNDLFRKARLRLLSPTGSGQPMSRQELADAANQHLPPNPDGPITENCICKIEQGDTRYPRVARRAALRAALGVTTDAEIGLFNIRRRPTDTLSARPPLNPTRPDTQPVAEHPGDNVDRRQSPRPWGGAGLSPSAAELNFKNLQQAGSADLMVESLPANAVMPGLPAAGAYPSPTVSNAISMYAVPCPGAENVSAIPDRLESDDWNSFSTVTNMLAQQRQTVAPAALLSLVEAHRDCLSTLFRKAGSDPIRAEIGKMLGEASIVASRLWSAQGNRSVALAHCAYARNLADRLGNVTLGATARIFESNLHSEASTLIQPDGDIMIGLRLLEEAQTASEHLGASARARIAAEQAQTYAALRLRNETEAALDRAREAASDITARDRTGLYSDWNDSRLQVYEGTCRILLNEPAEAIRLLSRK